MRSQVVFYAGEAFSNHFQLCRMCAIGTRKLHVHSGRIPETINAVLILISKPSRKEHHNLARPEVAMRRSNRTREQRLDKEDSALVKFGMGPDQEAALAGKLEFIFRLSSD